MGKQLTVKEEEMVLNVLNSHRVSFNGPNFEEQFKFELFTLCIHQRKGMAERILKKLPKKFFTAPSAFIELKLIEGYYHE